MTAATAIAPTANAIISLSDITCSFRWMSRSRDRVSSAPLTGRSPTAHTWTPRHRPTKRNSRAPACGLTCESSLRTARQEAALMTENLTTRARGGTGQPCDGSSGSGSDIGLTRRREPSIHRRLAATPDCRSPAFPTPPPRDVSDLRGLGEPPRSRTPTTFYRAHARAREDGYPPPSTC
jgi:hypothetical protein